MLSNILLWLLACLVHRPPSMTHPRSPLNRWKKQAGRLDSTKGILNDTNARIRSNMMGKWGVRHDWELLCRKTRQQQKRPQICLLASDDIRAGVEILPSSLAWCLSLLDFATGATAAVCVLHWLQLLVCTWNLHNEETESGAALKKKKKKEEKKQTLRLAAISLWGFPVCII